MYVESPGSIFAISTEFNFPKLPLRTTFFQFNTNLHMETPAYSQPEPSRPSPLLIGIVLAALLAVAAFWYFNSRGSSDETKYAFAINHAFENPIVFYGGKDLRYEITPLDKRLLKVYVPPQELNTPKYLLVEDGELDFLGFVKKNQTFIPLQLYQIHNARTGRPTAPVTDCKTYLQVATDTDSILVLIDGKHILPGKRVGPNLYVINFCETSREHEFQVLGAPNSSLAMKGRRPETFSLAGSGPSRSYWYKINASGDTIRYGLNPAMFGTAGISPTQQGIAGAPDRAIRPAQYSTDQGEKTAVTKVIFSMPRSMQGPWVYLNEKRITNFTLNANRNQVIFWVKQNGQPVKVRVGDNNCECQGEGRALNPVLELNGYCQCRDVQIYVQLDPGLDRYRNKIRIYVDGQLTDIPLPPAGQPLMFPVRKMDRDQYVELKLLLPDDTGNTGLFDVCNFTVPSEATTVNLSPTCVCASCPPNIKVSG